MQCLPVDNSYGALIFLILLSTKIIFLDIPSPFTTHALRSYLKLRKTYVKCGSSEVGNDKMVYSYPRNS